MNEVQLKGVHELDEDIYVTDDPVNKKDVCLVFEMMYDRDITQTEYDELMDFILSRDQSMVNWLKKEIKEWEKQCLVMK